MKQRPERGVEYAAFPTEEYRAHCSLEAVKSLAKAWGVTETRAADLLNDPDGYRAEFRSRGEAPCSCGCGLTGAQADRLPLPGLSARTALRELERRYAPPWMSR